MDISIRRKRNGNRTKEKKIMETNLQGGGINKIMLGDNNILVTCQCGVFEIYIRTVNGQHALIPNELICTKCGEIIKLKDFINGNRTG